jgi:hypothetical protein
MTKTSSRRHQLLIYRRIGFRLGNLPFLLMFGIGALLILGFVGSLGFLDSFANKNLLNLLWEGRVSFLALLVLCLALYITTSIIGRNSFVEARPKALRVKAGFFTLDISYRRIKEIKPFQFEKVFPASDLKGFDRSIADQLTGLACVGIVLKSWPVKPRVARRMWHKFMFLEREPGLLLAVREAMVLQNQIDHYVVTKQYEQDQYLDPVERAAAELRKQQKQSRR